MIEESVARMKCNGIRDELSCRLNSDSASLHPGYASLDQREMTKMWRSIVIILMCAATAAHAQVPSKSLVQVRSVKCHFGSGMLTDWTSGKARTSPARFDATVTFDSINLKAGTVRVIGNNGARDATITFSPLVGLTIFEAAPAVQDVTTIFPLYDKSGDFVAVDTRHVSVLGIPAAEQYFGTCQLMQ